MRRAKAGENARTTEREITMKQRYVKKKRLIAINEKAIKANANAIEPEFLRSISDSLRYPVNFALPFPERFGWVRCFVGIGTARQPSDEDFRSLLLDIPEADFKRLPTLEI
jgi:hypothetical protein